MSVVRLSLQAQICVFSVSSHKATLPMRQFTYFADISPVRQPPKMAKYFGLNTSFITGHSDILRLNFKITVLLKSQPSSKQYIPVMTLNVFNMC